MVEKENLKKVIEDLKKAGWVPEESNTVPEMSEEPTPEVKQEGLL